MIYMSNHTEIFEKILEMVDTLQEAQESLIEHMEVEKLKEFNVINDEMINVLDSIKGALETEVIKKRLSENKILELTAEFRDVLVQLKQEAQEASGENYEALQQFLNEKIPPIYESWKEEIRRVLLPLISN